MILSRSPQAFRGNQHQSADWVLVGCHWARPMDSESQSIPRIPTAFCMQAVARLSILEWIHFSEDAMRSVRSCLSIIFPLVVIALLLATPARAAMVLQGYNPQLHDRFNNDPSFVGNPYNWSGVGRSDFDSAARWGTLISPSFIVTASHFRIRNGDTVRFYGTNDPNGPVEVGSVVQSIILTQDGQPGSPLPSDVTLLRLNSPVTNTAYYPILNLPSNKGYLNQTIYTFGQAAGTSVTSQRLGRNQIEAVIPNFQASATSSNDVFLFDYDNPGGVGADESYVQRFDSGAPSFIIVNGQPALVGLHWFMYDMDDFGGLHGIGSGDSLISSFVDELNAAMASTGSSETVSVLTAIPEPSSFLVVLVSANGVALCSRRRRAA